MKPAKPPADEIILAYSALCKHLAEDIGADNDLGDDFKPTLAELRAQEMVKRDLLTLAKTIRIDNS